MHAWYYKLQCARHIMIMCGSFVQKSMSVLPTRTTAMTMLCVQTLRVVLSVCAILASVEMVCPVQVSHYIKYMLRSRFIACACMHACMCVNYNYSTYLYTSTLLLHYACYNL